MFSWTEMLIFAPNLMQPIEILYSDFSKLGNVVITTHQKPDADAMGSSLALMQLLQKLGNQVAVISPTNWAGWLNWMPGNDQVLNFEKNHHAAIEKLQAADYLFCLDFNTLSRTKRMQETLKMLSCKKVLIDHHREPNLEYFDYGISDFTKSSTCEMIYDVVINSSNRNLLDKEMASCIYAGIIGDTGSFRFDSTTASVHKLVSDLFTTGLNHSYVHEKLFDNYLENRLRFIGHMLSNRLEFFYEYNTALIAISKSDLIKYAIKTGDTEGLVNIPQAVQGIKLVAMVVDRDEERKWSFRSKGDFDCSEFARKYFNGGGHFNAAGGQTYDSLQDTVEVFKKSIKEIENLLQ